MSKRKRRLRRNPSLTTTALWGGAAVALWLWWRSRSTRTQPATLQTSNALTPATAAATAAAIATDAAAAANRFASAATEAAAVTDRYATAGIGDYFQE